MKQSEIRAGKFYMRRGWEVRFVKNVEVSNNDGLRYVLYINIIPSKVVFDGSGPSMWVKTNCITAKSFARWARFEVEATFY